MMLSFYRDIKCFFVEDFFCNIGKNVRDVLHVYQIEINKGRKLKFYVYPDEALETLYERYETNE